MAVVIPQPIRSTMHFRLSPLVPPGADSVDLRLLGVVLTLPAAFGLAVAALVGAVSPDAVGIGGWAAFAQGMVELSYLGTAAAQAGFHLVETLGLAGGDEGAAPPAGPWRLFPNALDAAVLAFALTLAVKLAA